MITTKGESFEYSDSERPMTGLQTVCTAGHIRLVKPATIEHGEAIFGSRADFCALKRCGRPVIERTPIYASQEG